MEEKNENKSPMAKSKEPRSKTNQDQAAALTDEKERTRLQIQELKGFLLSEELVRGYLQRFFKNFDKQNLNERQDALKYTLNYVEVYPE